MKKFVSIIATAAIAGSMAMAGAVSASANDGMGGYSIHKDVQISVTEDIPLVTPAEAPAEVTTEAAVTTTEIAATTTEAVSSEVTVPVTETTASTGIRREDAEKTALAEAAKTGFIGDVINAEYNSANGYWEVTLKRHEGTKVLLCRVSENSIVVIDPEAEEASAATAATAAATTASAKAASSTTAQSTTAAATTTKAAAKNGSPKTGVPFPVISAAGLLTAAAVAAFSLRKKEN